MHLVEMHQEEYEQAAGKFEKTAIAMRIVNMIVESFGRFLKWEKEGWVEVDQEAAREEILHSFHHLRSKTSTDTNQVHQGATSKRVITPCPSPKPDQYSGETPDKSARTSVDENEY